MMDDDLSKEFARLRAHEAHEVRGFAATVARATRGRSRPIREGRIALALVALALVVLVVSRALSPGGAPSSIQFTNIGRWSSPTDFLLHTPGSDLLGSMSGLGLRADWYPVGSAKVPGQ